MNTQNENRFYHPKFKLQGNSFNTVSGLISYSKEISNEISNFLEEWFDNELFIEVFTSGSTGVPKKIKLQKKHMINSALATGNYFNLLENTSALLCLSTQHIAGKMMLVRALTLGWNIDVVAPSSTPLKTIDKLYDFSAMVPMQLYHSFDKINNIKTLIVGGGVISNTLLSKLENCKTNVFATYGMTETITHIAVKKLNGFSNNQECIHANYTVLPFVAISQDSRGCLVIDAPKISENKIVTNDVVELVSNTTFKWLGRYDNVINSGGVKLHPEQIEQKLASFFANTQFFVIGVPDKVLGEKLVLVIESSGNDINVQQLQTKIKSETTLSKFEVPREVYTIEKFMETDTKKVKRKETLQACLK